MEVDEPVRLVWGAPSRVPWRSRSAQPFALRAELRGHGEDVRGLALAGGHGLASTSRDKTLRLWPLADSPTGVLTDSRVFVGHTHFVGPVAWAPPGLLAVAPEGALVTGSRDTSLILWHTTAAVPLQRLAGHTQQARAALGIHPEETPRQCSPLTRCCLVTLPPGVRALRDYLRHHRLR